MGKVKEPPCGACIKYPTCKKFFVDRLNDYDPNRDMCEDYNSESFILLGRECDLFNEYLFLDHIAFPSRNYHFMWWPDMKSKISEPAWMRRYQHAITIWGGSLEPRSM